MKNLLRLFKKGVSIFTYCVLNACLVAKIIICFKDVQICHMLMVYEKEKNITFQRYRIRFVISRYCMMLEGGE